MNSRFLAIGAAAVLLLGATATASATGMLGGPGPGTCIEDCDGTPDQDRTQDQDRLRTGAPTVSAVDDVVMAGAGSTTGDQDQVRAQDGSCDGDCDGTPDQDRIRDQDGTCDNDCDGTPDRDRDQQRDRDRDQVQLKDAEVAGAQATGAPVREQSQVRTKAGEPERNQAGGPAQQQERTQQQEQTQQQEHTQTGAGPSATHGSGRGG